MARSSRRRDRTGPAADRRRRAAARPGRRSPQR
ncbi:class F sortase, partial [Micromonospora aurantiaca]|nr:class F sortase [Micromonospora aurantiaca]